MKKEKHQRLPSMSIGCEILKWSGALFCFIAILCKHSMSKESIHDISMTSFKYLHISKHYIAMTTFNHMHLKIDQNNLIFVNSIEKECKLNPYETNVQLIEIQ